MGMRNRLGLGLAAGLAAIAPSGCSEAQPVITVKPPVRVAEACGRLISFDQLGGNQYPGQNALNTGHCVDVYDENSLETVAKIPSEATFIISCIAGPKPPSLEVIASERNEDIVGTVQLDGAALNSLMTGALKHLPTC